MANYFQIFPPLVFSYQLFIFSNRGNFQARTWVWRKFAAENRVKEGIGQESNGAANQEKQIFLLCQISPSASSTRDLGTRLSKKFTYFAHFIDYSLRPKAFFITNVILFTGQTLTLLTILIIYLHLHLHCTAHTYTIYTSTTYNTYNTVTISNHLIKLQWAYSQFFH